MKARARPWAILLYESAVMRKLASKPARCSCAIRTGIRSWKMSETSTTIFTSCSRSMAKPMARRISGSSKGASRLLNPREIVHASMLGYSIEPTAAAVTARQYQAAGYTAQKWFFQYGPAHGSEGEEKNLAMATAVREAVGPNYKLMFDAFMGWDRNYATRMLQALEPLTPMWMEEPIPPERVGEFAQLRASSRTPIATGEHVRAGRPKSCWFRGLWIPCRTTRTGRVASVNW